MDIMRDKVLLLILLLICTIPHAQSQEYTGPGSTVKGLLPPQPVGSGEVPVAGLGSAPAFINLTGRWSLDLKDIAIKHVDLQMVQGGDLLLGRGTMTADGMEAPVVAAGTISESRLNIFVCTQDGRDMYRILLSPAGSLLSGDFQALSSEGETGVGRASGLISTPLLPSTAIVVGKGGYVSPAAVGRSAQSLEDLPASDPSEHVIRKRSFSSTYDGAMTQTTGTVSSSPF
jgi:hypothetical protein